MYDLTACLVPDSGWSLLTEARAINNEGQIIGYGEKKDGSQSGFLLTPIQE